VARIRDLGGTVYYDYHRYQDEQGKVCIDPTRQPRGSELARRWLGNDFFASVIMVQFAKGLVTPYYTPTALSRNADAELAAMNVLSDLEVLDLAHSEVTDEGLEHVAKFGKLRVVDLRSTKVTPEGVTQLRNVLPQCKIIHPR
jgi:hypothetical protein